MPEETMSKEQQTELLFMQLVMMFQGMAMQQLGKVMNPMTQKIDRDLGQAKNFIDLLAMLEEKTEGNLGEGEQKLLQQALFDLRMNYVDEVKKEAAEAEPDAGSESGSEDEREPESSESEAESEEGGEPESAEGGSEEGGEPESTEAKSEEGGEPESTESDSEDEGEPESTGSEAKSEDIKGSSDEEPTV